jgi:hypothetical protein
VKPILSSSMLAACLLAAASLASAQPIIFERALPIKNINNGGPGSLAPGYYRANTKWAPTGNYIIGDDFTIQGSSAIVNSLTVWVVAENPGTTDPSQELSSISLYGGTDSGLALLSSTYTATPASYIYGVQYWNPVRGIYEPMFAVTFANLNWFVPADTLMDFAVQGVTALGTNHALSLAASTAQWSWSRQDGADGYILAFAGVPYSLFFAYNSDPSNWGSDINVAITGTLANPGLAIGAVQMDSAAELSTASEPSRVPAPRRRGSRLATHIAIPDAAQSSAVIVSLPTSAR